MIKTDQGKKILILMLLFTVGMSYQVIEGQYKEPVIEGSCLEGLRVNAGNTFLNAGSAIICNTKDDLIITVTIFHGYYGTVDHYKIGIDINHDNIDYKKIGQLQFGWTVPE